MLEGIAGQDRRPEGGWHFVYERQGKGNGKLRGRSEARTGAVLDHITEPNSPGCRSLGVIGAGPGRLAVGGPRLGLDEAGGNSEPPDADPHVRWCGRREGNSPGDSIRLICLHLGASNKLALHCTPRGNTMCHPLARRVPRSAHPLVTDATAGHVEHLCAHAPRWVDPSESSFEIPRGSGRLLRRASSDVQAGRGRPPSHRIGK
jgi:hypothetical protein